MRVFVRAEGVIDGTGSGLSPGAGLLLEDGRIAAVDSAGKLERSADAVEQLDGHVIVPGFVDAHSHITVRPGEGDQHGQLLRNPVWQALRGVGNLAQDLASGVTTLRVMGEKHGIDVEFKDAIERGEIAGPRLLVASKALSPSHGHGAAFGAVDGVDALRVAVRDNVRAGADHIKIFATGGVSSAGTSLAASNYTRSEVRTVVEEAHRLGRRVAAHAHGGDGVDLCAEEGVDSIEHGAMLSPGNVGAMVEHNTWLVLTNSILFRREGIEGGDASEASILAKLAEARASAERSFAAARAAGIRYALGTDSMHGFFGYEMEWLVDRGVPAEEALLAGTLKGAEVVGIQDEAGSLEPGKRADFVALEGNPLEDIRSVRRTAAVFIDGLRRWSRETASGTAGKENVGAERRE